MSYQDKHRSINPQSFHNMSALDKRRRLVRWMHWRKAGYTGRLLINRTKLTLTTAKRFADELGISLEGLL